MTIPTRPQNNLDPTPAAESVLCGKTLLPTDLRTQCSHSFRKALSQTVEANTNETITIDFQGIHAISAACLGVLAEFANQVQVQNVPPRIQQVFEITGLHQVLNVAA